MSLFKIIKLMLFIQSTVIRENNLNHFYLIYLRFARHIGYIISLWWHDLSNLSSLYSHYHYSICFITVQNLHIKHKLYTNMYCTTGTTVHKTHIFVSCKSYILYTRIFFTIVWKLFIFYVGISGCPQCGQEQYSACGVQWHARG